ncbi:hypothetical protein JI435_140460 [Parastagonospora nodorum SN15]|uniref:G protein-coupled receptor GPR1 C-terminal domain-containing protein n=1 Tax=Phaeosphaeria nodorum (strain SN15 / ATCC MYA-4574 / FGSC 10173) TaxID=321614 RepID=A0A7U2F1M3_PHANO|nr:hypothetical protein JI435_140460 [Parastagonospora nodorum SN15]
MTKLFRHRLIMLLVYGDLMRSIWFFVFTVYSLARGTVETNTRFCQASGFFIQYGTETSVLVVAVHSALQIFRPAGRGNSDGLYDYRSYIFSGAFLLPGMMAALAFLNPGPAYESLGAYCQLPIRPFWYRLALAWIPRYCVAIIILSLAGAIYAYVGCEFRSYASISQSSMTPVTTAPGLSLIDGKPATPTAPGESLRRTTSAPLDFTSSGASHRRGSAVAFGPTTYAPAQQTTAHAPSTQSLPGSSTLHPPKRTASVRPGLFVIPSGYAVQPPSSTLDLEGPLSPHTQSTVDPMSTIVPATPVTTTYSRHRSSSSTPGQRHLARQRRRIHRQLRLMFIYPIAYILMWIMPFVHHSMNYSDRYANHPLWFIRVGQAICLTSMGFVDCLIFSIREKPWRNISTSDGTIWGSLAVWRTPRSSVSTANSEETGYGNDSRQRSMTESGVSRVKRVRNSVRTSASDDQTRLASEQARKRLELEKDERLVALTKRMERGSEVLPIVEEKEKEIEKTVG